MDSAGIMARDHYDAVPLLTDPLAVIIFPRPVSVLNQKDRACLADLLSTVACEILKGETPRQMLHFWRVG